MVQEKRFTMKIYAQIKEVDKWIKFTENLIKNHPKSDVYKQHLVTLQQQRTDLATQIGNGIFINRTKFFKQN